MSARVMLLTHLIEPSDREAWAHGLSHLMATSMMDKEGLGLDYEVKSQDRLKP